MSRRESVQNLVGINDWPTQLAVLKVMFNTEDLNVKYLDDEEEEVKIDSQNDYEFANQIASSSTNNILRLIVRNSRDEIVGKVNLSVDLTTKSMSESLENSRITSSIDSMRSSIERIMPPPPPSNTSSTTSTLPPPPTVIVASSSNPPFTPAQIAWLDQHLGKFKSELMREIATNNNSGIGGIQRGTLLEDPNLISFIENETTASLENKVQRLFQLIVESRMLKRSLKVAYLEEELQSTGAFMAEFIKDQNMPDGSECEPGMRFDKTWLIRNIGKLEWTESKFPVRLVCIAGNIAAVDDVDCVNVTETCVGESASVSVTLIAPPTEGTYFSEWVLCCNGFKFGPRIWCTIQVTGDAENKEQLSLATSIYSEKANKAAAAAAAAASQQAPSSMGGEDLDDEFVVIPDCFDLDKKWNKRKQQQQQQKQQQSNKDESPVYSKPASINELGFHDDSDDDDFSPKSEPPPNSSVSVDLIMLDSDPVNKSLRPSDVSAINKSSLESSIERINTEPVESSTEIVVKRQQPASDTTYLSRLVGERLTLLETQDPQIDFDDDLIETLETPRGSLNNNNNNNNLDDPRVTPERLPRQNESSSPGNHVNSNISQAIGLMKDALSNLGRPSYVGSISMANETDDNVEVATMSVDENMKKLIMMGFANRQLNLKLLNKHNNDLNKVIQNLLDVNDNDWAQNR